MSCVVLTADRPERQAFLFGIPALITRTHKISRIIMVTLSRIPQTFCGPGILSVFGKKLQHLKLHTIIYTYRTHAGHK